MREHPGLSETVLQECLDIWLLEHLSECGFTFSENYPDSLFVYRSSVRDLAEQLAALVWRMVEPLEGGKGGQPFYGPVDQVPSQPVDKPHRCVECEGRGWKATRCTNCDGVPWSK